MKVRDLIKPAGLLVAGTFGATANAAVVVDETDYDATYGGTDITLAGAGSAQFTFELRDLVEVSTKAYLVGNDGASVATPGTDVYASEQLTGSSIFPFGGGDYGILFSANGINYQGTATLINGGFTIDRITYDVAGAGAVPEPATWAMMLLGFGAAGTALRRSRRRQSALATA
jgi:hypothetical protein